MPSGRVLRQRGFTLIELLVVVAIIALLISILLPSLTGARRQAKQLLCLTNQAEMGKAALIYADENNDTLVRAERDLHFTQTMMPALGYNGSDLYDLFNFRRACRGHRRHVQVCASIPQFQCSDWPDVEPTSSDNSPFCRGIEQSLHYVVNSFAREYSTEVGTPGQAGETYRNIGSHDNNGNPLVPQEQYFRLTDFGRRSPSELIYITEAHTSLPSDRLDYHDVMQASMIPFGAFPRVANDRRHPRGVTALFFDGHADVLPLNELDPGWPSDIGFRLRYFTTVPAE